jgi:nucleotide-binding universal stress UspA family protein
VVNGDIPRIFVGLRASVGSMHALRYAVAEARRRGGVLHSVHAWTPPGGDALDRRLPEPHLHRIWVAAAMQELRTAWEDGLGAVPDDLPVRLCVEKGHPGWVLTRLADREDDLIVVGAGRGGVVRRMLHVSVARFCVARARCQVLVVPQPPLARGVHGVLRRRRAMHDLLNDIG